MSELAIAIYGHALHFDRRAGPLVALIEVEGGTSSYLVDCERNRCRIESFPGRDLDRWTTPDGVLLAARRGWWGLTVRLDYLPRPTPSHARTRLMLHREFQRPRLPRDLASCPRCGQVVVIARERKGDGFCLVTPSRRLARRASEVMAADGLFGLVTEAHGRGRVAGRPHAGDCYALPLFAPFASTEPAPGPLPPRGRRSTASRPARWRSRPG